jgi:putative SOS response-associated peptidase YedK
LRPYPDDLMVAWRVTRRVNDTRTNDASLIEPIE